MGRLLSRMAEKPTSYRTGSHRMLMRIVHNSPKLCAFFDQLVLDLSKPQCQHMLNLADALEVCEDRKTLTALLF